MPTFNRPVPQKRSDSALVIDNNKPKSAPVQEKSLKPSMSKSELLLSKMEAASSSSSSSAASQKPELKEKPQFSTFKQQQQQQSSSNSIVFRKSEFSAKNSSSHNNHHHHSPPSRRRLSKVASESDLVQSLQLEEEEDLLEEKQIHENTHEMFIESSGEPVSITISQEDSSEDNTDVIRRSSYYIQSVGGGGGEEEDLHNKPSPPLNKLIIDTSKSTFKTQRSISTDSLLSEPKRSEPLQITTEPLNDLEAREGEKQMLQLLDTSSVEAMSDGPDKSCSTSFESTDDSLLTESRPMMAMRLGGGGGSNDSGSSCDATMTRTKSPSTSTTSRSPPSPAPLGLSPIRQVSL